MENIRRKISAILSSEFATEDNPLECNVTIGESEACGLSTLEMIHTKSLFQDQEGIIWINIEGSDEPIEFDQINKEEASNILRVIN